MLLLFYEREVEMKENQKNIAVLVSGGGTNLQALIDAEKRGELGCGKITLVIASKPDVYALERDKNNSIKSLVLARKDYASIADYSKALTDVLTKEQTDLVVLAGFLTIIDEQVYEKFENRILNVHPALIPSFCGKGYYGLRVHEAALEKGVKVSGATVHIVTPECDAGPIVLQKAVEVLEGDTPEILQKRIMEQAEWKILPEAVRLFCDGRIKVENNRVTIKGE
jgi:phosphoribosylglycinamide formyltransferase-1